MLTPEQVEERRGGVGGSDVAAIIGTSPYATATDIYHLKLGVAEVEETQAMYWGNALERSICSRYKATRPNIGFYGGFNGPGMLPHRELPWCFGTPDAVVEYLDLDTGESARWGLEVKTANAFAAREWDEGVPQHYVEQVQWYLFVTGLARWDVAVLIGGSDYREFTLARDEKRQAELFDAAHHFWFGHVLRELPPEPTTPAEFARSVPADNGVMLRANADAEQAIFCYKHALDTLRVVQTEVDDMKAHIQRIIGENAGIEGPWGKITWRRSGKSRRFLTTFVETD